MNSREYIHKIREILVDPPLNDIQELVFKMCWQGKTYTEIAKASKYEESYIRDIGAKLWQRLSTELDTKISKNNLHSKLESYLANYSNSSAIPIYQPSKALIANNHTFSTSISDSKLYRLESAKVKFPSGVVPLTSAYYITRSPSEQVAYKQIENPGSILRIKAPQKMGKSSLLIRVVNQGVNLNYHTVQIDFKQADTTTRQNIDQFLRWFCTNVTHQLDKASKIDELWDLELGSKVSCNLYFQNYILAELNKPLLIALNDVDELYQAPHIAQDFFSLLRFWHEQTHQLKIWQKLRLVITYATENHVPLNIYQSPFNVGLTVKLPNFTVEQVTSLGMSYGFNGKQQNSDARKSLADLHQMVGGHPYLIQLALYHLSQENGSLEELLKLAPTEAGIYSNYLRSLTALIEEKPKLRTALMKLAIARNSIKLDSRLAYQLESLGIIERQGNLVRLSCKLYRLYFRDLLILNRNTQGYKSP